MEVIGLTVTVHDPRRKSLRYPLQEAGWAPGAGLDLLEKSETLLLLVFEPRIAQTVA
jgi:hypothetical protein